jgi:anti-anti-sigma factor
MSVKKTVSNSGKEVKISIDERFDFSLHQEFRDAYSSEETQGGRFELDLSNTSYMDSSALGMILLLKDHAEKFGGTVIIQKPNEAVNKILEIAQFHRLLTIEA